MATKKTKKVVGKSTPSTAKKATKIATSKSSKKVAKKVPAKPTSKKATNKVTKKVASKSTAKTTKKVVAAAAKASPKTAKKVAKKVVKKAKRTTTKKRLNAANNDSLIHGIRPYSEKAREKYMSANQVDHFRSILLAWKANLLDEVSKTIHLMQDENINHPDPNDRASQETDMSLELRNRDRERKLLKKIESTITRVDGGDYGWCDRCGIEIGIRRLEARPTAELCVDCKTLNEIKERQMI